MGLPVVSQRVLDRLRDGRRLLGISGFAELLVELAKHLGPLDRGRQGQLGLGRRIELVLLALLSRLRRRRVFAAALEVGTHEAAIEHLGLALVVLE